MNPTRFEQRAGELAAASSFLFVGADDERRLRKALCSRAHVVIADLEDAVAPARKQEARETLRRVLVETNGRSRGLTSIRVNAVETQEAAEDMSLIDELEIDGVVVPKASTALEQFKAPAPVVAIVETASGLRSAHEIGALPQVARMMLGSVDLSVELGLSRLPQSVELLHARSALVLDSAAAGIARPIDGVQLDVHDQHRLRSEAAYARSLGFGAKACVHPSQIAVVNQTFCPRAHEVAWARKVDEGYREALAEGHGALLVGGQMVDAPIARRARAILAEADQRD